MKLKEVTIWIWEDYLTDPQIQEAVKAFGGIKVLGKPSQDLANQYDKTKNLYEWFNADPTISMRYLGEFGTRRVGFPFLEFSLDTYYADESSPERIKDIPLLVKNIGYSSYRTTLFTVVKQSSDINIRIPILSPIWTLKRLHKKYRSRHKWVWLDLKKNLNFCYPYKTFLDPEDTVEGWSFKSFMKIPFQWHVRRMIKFCDNYGKKLFIYSGDYDVSKESVLEGISIIKNYFVV